MSKHILVISTSPRKGGQMKTMLDRANPLYDSDYRFRDIYLLAAVLTWLAQLQEIQHLKRRMQWEKQFARIYGCAQKTGSRESVFFCLPVFH